MSQKSEFRSTLSLSFTLLFCLGFFAVTLMPGCSGCRRGDPAAKKKKEDEEKKKKKKKPKKDFEVARLVTEPSDDTVAQDLAKPGHWLIGTQKMLANNFDFQAEINSRVTDGKTSKTIPVEGTEFNMHMTRPASLPKGQIKHFEIIYFVPRDESLARSARKPIWLESQLRSQRTGAQVTGAAQPMIAMAPHEYLMVVLSDDPDRYAFLKRLDSVRPVSGGLDQDVIQHYRVVLPKIKRRIPLPSHPLAWTSTAYIIWDDLPPAKLNPGQEDALLDWLHWGGQLIISGPNSLDALRNTFLEDYLPASAGKAIELGQEDFAEMSEHWSLPEAKNKREKSGLKLDPKNPLIGVELKRHSEAEYLPKTGGLVIERKVGRGRIVVTAFRLSDKPVLNWGTRFGNFDGFFNACLLRRPPRVYRARSELLEPELQWVDFRDHKDPRLVTTLRYFSRDMGHASLRSRQLRQQAQAQFLADPTLANQEPEDPAPPDRPYEVSKDDWHFGGFQRDARLSGVAGWNDTGGTAAAARRSLDVAGGIEVPKSSFVLKVLAGYLIVLVPINWGLFRLIGRVEWAWIAAPLIAIVGTVVVVRQAQLDIGFIRKRAEVAVLEVHGGYQRAHLTRYARLYTSLASHYNMIFESDTALAQPFAVRLDQDYTKTSQSTVTFRRDSGVSLRGFKIPSNQERAIHSEEMFSLGGALDVSGDRDKGFDLNNGTEISLRDIGVIHRVDDGSYEMAWVGDIDAKTSVRLSFSSGGNSQPFFPQWQTSPNMSLKTRKEGEVSLGPMVELAAQKLRMRIGEMRLIGWTDKELPGLTIRPAASQRTFNTFVLAHLRPGGLPPARRDANCKGDFMVDDPTETDPDFDFSNTQDSAASD